MIALTLLPSHVPLRLGIGLCFHKLGDFEKARAAYQRTLELDPNNVDAMAGLISLNMNSGNLDLMREGIVLLKKAHTLDSLHPAVLNGLANHFFHRKEYAKAQFTATAAYQQSEVDAVKAESCYYLAKSYHVRNEYDLAYQYYFQALQLDPDVMIARFGLGQMWLYKGNTAEARVCFEKVLEKDPKSHEATKILGSLLSKEKSVEDRAKAETYLSKVVETDPNDLESWIELAELLEKTDVKKSLKACRTALNLWGSLRADIPLPPELLNNIGAMSHREGLLQDALKYYEKAIETCETPEDSLSREEKGYRESLLVTLKYNRARVWEDTNADELAKATYLEISKQHPSYLDCYLRLGCISMKTGHYAESSDWFSEVLAVDKDNANAWSLMGLVHMKKNEWKPCQKKFERILTNTDKHDLYALVTLGNVLLRSLKYEQTKQQVEQYYRRSLEYFHKALTLDSHNIYAANGIGVVLAEKGHFQEAKEIFIKVRESTADFPDAWTNLAHIYSEMDQHVNAIKLYEGCSKRFFDNKDVPTLLYIARAYYHVGRNDKEVEMITKCRKYLEKSLLLRPWDHSIRFNIALAQQESAVIVLRKSVNERTLKQVKQAQEQIRSAQMIFAYLSETTPYPKNSYEPKMASERAKYCAESLASIAKKHLEKQLKEEKGKEDKILSLEQQKAQAEEEERQRLAEIQRKKNEEQADVERRRKEIQELAMQAISKSAEIIEPSKGRKRQHDSDSEGEKSIASDDSDRERTPKPKKEKKPRKEKKGDDGEKKKKKKDKQKRKAKPSGEEKERETRRERKVSDDDEEGDTEESRKKSLEAYKSKRKSAKKRSNRGMDDVIADSDEEAATSKPARRGEEDDDDDDDDDESEQEGRKASDSDIDAASEAGEGKRPLSDAEDEPASEPKKGKKRAVVSDDEESEAAEATQTPQKKPKVAVEEEDE